MQSWTNRIPEKCDICEEPITEVFFDVATVEGPWGNLCYQCFLKHGTGLGVGQGQCYEKQGDEFVKVELPQVRILG